MSLDADSIIKYIDKAISENPYDFVCFQTDDEFQEDLGAQIDE